MNVHTADMNSVETMDTNSESTNRRDVDCEMPNMYITSNSCHDLPLSSSTSGDFLNTGIKTLCYVNGPQDIKVEPDDDYQFSTLAFQFEENHESMTQYFSGNVLKLNNDSYEKQNDAACNNANEEKYAFLEDFKCSVEVNGMSENPVEVMDQKADNEMVQNLVFENNDCNMEENSKGKRNTDFQKVIECQKVDKLCGTTDKLNSTHSTFQPVTEEKPYVRTTCHKKYSQRKSLQNHLTVHQDKSLICPTCGKLLSKHSLKVHMRIHTGEKPHICITCDKKFSSKTGLRQHKRIHTDEKPHICATCDKRFKNRIGLKKHIRIHTGEKPYTCVTCGKGFRQRNNLKGHLRIHTGDKPYVCSVCNRGFSLKGNLKEHMGTHTGEKPYICNICSRGFLQNRFLRRHMKIHTGEKTYFCTTCGKGFIQSGGLKIHMKKHTGEKMICHVCSICEKGFANKSDLQRHMRIHTGEKPYLCSVCGKGFNQSAHLHKHMKTHKGKP